MVVQLNRGGGERTGEPSAEKHASRVPLRKKEEKKKKGKTGNAVGDQKEEGEEGTRPAPQMREVGKRLNMPRPRGKKRGGGKKISCEEEKSCETLSLAAENEGGTKKNDLFYLRRKY